MTIDRRYWDSDAFLGYLNDEKDKASACHGVLEAAQSGRILIVTSALTITEVLHVKNQKPVPAEKRDLIAKFFKQPYISVQNVTRKIAEFAQSVYWDHGIQPKDAIHVATAIINRIPVLNTFDDKLLKSTGRIGDPPLRIELLHEPGQNKLDL